MPKFFQTIKVKLIVTIVVTLIIAFSGLLTITSFQLKKKTEESVIHQSEVIVKETTNSAEQFLNHTIGGIHQLSMNDTVTEFVQVELATEGQETSLQAQTETKKIDGQLNNYIKVFNETTSVYTALSNRKFVMSPNTKLPDDFDPRSREWYKLASQEPDIVHWSEPFVDVVTNEFVIAASKAVVNDNKKVNAVVGADIKLAELTDKLSKVELGYQGYPVMFSKKGLALVHPDKKGEDLSKESFVEKVLSSGQTSGNINFSEDGKDYLLVYNTVPNTGWVIGAVYDQKILATASNDIITSLLITGILTLVLVSVVLYFVSIRFSKPIMHIRDIVTEVAAGRLDIKADVKSQDEIGQLGNQLNVMIQKLYDILKVVQTSVYNVRESSEGLSAVAEETNASSEQVALAVNEIAIGATKSAEEADHANQRFIQLGNQINVATEQALSMSDVAVQAEKMNKNGLQQVGRLDSFHASSNQSIDSMQSVVMDLEEKIKRIETVMSTITEISAQTNLLALNASIEAARAGEHGRGFAVVADEVRKLAEQSARATDEVKETILQIQEGSHLAVSEMTKTKEIFAEQSEVVEQTSMIFSQTSEFVQQMQNAIIAIVDEIKKVADDKDEVVKVIQEMAAMSEETAAACEEVSASTDEQVRAIQTVSQSAEHLTRLGEQLQDAVNQFRV